MLMRGSTRPQEYLPRHGDDGNEVSLALVGNKPDAREAFKLVKCLQEDVTAGFIWGGNTLAEPLTKTPEPL